MPTPKPPSGKGVVSRAAPKRAVNGEGQAIAVHISPAHAEGKPGGVGEVTAMGEATSLVLHSGQTQTLSAKTPKRYRIGRALGAGKASELPVEMAEQLVVLRQGNDLWLHTAHNASLLLSGFFDTDGSQLQLDWGDNSWLADTRETGPNVAGTDAQLLYWRGPAEHWSPDFLHSAQADLPDFARHKTQLQLTPPPVAEALPVGPEAAPAPTASSGLASDTAATASSNPSVASTPTGTGAASSAATAAPAAAPMAAPVSVQGLGSVMAASSGVGAAVLGVAGAVGMAAALGSKPKDSSGASSGSGGSGSSSGLGALVTPGNQAPTAVALTSALSGNALAENTSTSSRTKVADMAITDDALGSNTISLSGADAASFEVVGNALYLKAGVALNFEAKPSYAVNVNVVDSSVTGSSSLSAAYTLSVTDVNEAPSAVSLTSALSGNAILETASTASRTKVADMAITDDALGSNTISLSGADAASFEVVGNALYLKAGVGLNYSQKSSYNVTVNVADASLSGASAVSSNYSLSVTGVPTNLGGSFTAGPAISGNGLVVQVYRADTGELLTTSKVRDDGTYTFEVKYVGAVVVVIHDIDTDPNNPGADYLDESNGAVDLVTDLRSLTYVGTPGVAVTAHVTPLTEIAATLATGKTAAQAAAAGYAAPTLTATVVSNTNKALAQMLGLGDLDITTAVATAVTDASGNANSSANAYGRLLAAISHAGDLKTVVATMAAGIQLDASSGTASFSSSSSSSAQVLLAQGIAGAEIAHGISFANVTVLQEVKAKGEQAAGQALLSGWVGFEEGRASANTTWASQHSLASVREWALKDNATALAQKTALAAAATAKEAQKSQLASTIQSASDLQAQAQAHLSQNPNSASARSLQSDTALVVKALNTMAAQQGSVDNVASLAFARRSNPIKAAIRVLDSPSASSEAKANALATLDAQLQAVRAQENTQIDKTSSLAVYQKLIADNLADLAQSFTQLRNANSAGKAAAQAKLDQAAALVLKVVQASADLIAADKATADAWSQAVAQANRAQRTVDSPSTDANTAVAAKAALAKATDSIQQAEQTAADKANTEKVYAQALSTLWLAQQAAQTQASQNNSDANQASLALAQTALAQAISTWADKTASEKVTADLLSQALARVDTAQAAFDNASATQKATALSALQNAQAVSDQLQRLSAHKAEAEHVTAQAYLAATNTNSLQTLQAANAAKASAEATLAQATALQAKLVLAAQAAQATAQTTLDSLPANASARQAAQDALSQAQQTLIDQQSQLSLQLQLSADKAAAEKVASLALAQQLAQAQTALGAATQAQQTLTRLANDNSAAAQASKAAAQTQLNQAEQAQSNAQAAIDQLQATWVQKTLDQALQTESIATQLERITLAQAVLQDPLAAATQRGVANAVMARAFDALTTQLHALADKFAQEKIYQVQSAMAKQLELAENSTDSIALGVAGVDGLSWQLIDGGSNSALQLSSDGQLRFGTAQNFETDTQSHTLRIALSDSMGHSAQQTITVRLRDVNEAPVLISTPPAAQALLGQMFEFQANTYFSDVDANDRLRYSATGLPEGLRISADGVITGVPVKTGAPAQVQITATDLGGLSRSTSLTLGVVERLDVVAVSAAPQADRLVHGGEYIDLQVQLNETVVVQGTPKLNLLINDNPVQASYTSGSGSNKLLFRLTAPNLGNGSDIQVAGIETGNATVVGQSTGQSLLSLLNAVRTSDITIDNSPPVSPRLALASDTGPDSGDGVTQSGAVRIDGLEPNATWSYSLDSGATWTAGEGSGFTLPSASYVSGQVQVRQTDAAGNPSSVTSSPIAWRIDASAPTAQLSVELAGDASVVKANSTATLRLVLSEPVMRLPSVSSVAGSLSEWQAVSDTEYTATFTPKSLIEGSFALSLGEFQDAAGNIGSFSNDSANRIRVDTRPPTAPSLSLTDTGRSNSDGVSQNASLQVNGLEPNATWSYSVDGGLNWSNGSGDRLSLANGLYTRGQILVRQTDTAGNRSGVGMNAQQWQIDTTAPGVTIQTVSADNVVNASERSAGVRIAGSSSGTAAGDVVTVGWGNASQTTSVASDGSWEVNFASSDIASGEVTSVVHVRITDLAGNVGNASPQNVRIDTLAPSLGLPANLMPSLVDDLGTGLSGVLADNILNAAERAIIVAGPNGTWTLKGSTSAEVGQSVTVSLNGRFYTGSVGTGSNNLQTWSVPITSADVAELAHGNRYTVTVDTFDSAGNPAERVSQTIDVSLHGPDVPVVQSLRNSSYTPTLSGSAQKAAINAANTAVALEHLDSLSVAIKLGTTQVASYSLTVGEGNLSTLGPLSYNQTNKQWALNLALETDTSKQVKADGIYDVVVSVLPNGFDASTATKTDQSSGEWVVKTTAPTLSWNNLQAQDNRLNASEVKAGVALSGSVSDLAPGSSINMAQGRSVVVGIDGLASTHPLAQKTWSATVGADGSWQLTLPSADLQALGAGHVGFKARFDSVFGGSVQSSKALVVDTSGPQISLSVPDDTELSTSEAGLWFTRLGISDGSGTGIDSQSVRLLKGNQVVNSADLAIRLDSQDQAVGLLGDFSQLVDGSYTIEVVAKDLAGNSSSQRMALRLDQTAPTLGLSTDANGLRVQKGEVATVRLNLSEAASALPTITPSVGSLSAWRAVDDTGLSFEADWTPPLNATGTLAWTLGTWQDIAGNGGSLLGSLPSMGYDTQTPSVVSLRILGDSTDQRFKTGETIEVQVQFSEDMLVTGQPSLVLQVGDAVRNANYIGRLVGSNATLVFRYVVQSGDTDANGVSIAPNALRLGSNGSIKDLYGNAAALEHASVGDQTLAKVDTTAPTVAVGLVDPSDAFLAQGQSAVVRLQFSEQPLSLPAIGVTKGSLSAWTRVSDTVYTATFTPASNITSGQVNWSMAAWVDLAGNPGSLSGNWPALSVDSTAPVVTSVTDTTAASITKDSVRFVVTLSEALDTPLGLTHFEATNGTVTAVQASADGRQYTVDATPSANTQGQYLALRLIAGGVKDLAGNPLNDQDLGLLGKQLIDTQAPSLSGVTIQGNASKPVFKAGETIPFGLSFDEAVSVSGKPSLAIDVGGQTRYATYTSGSGTNSLVFAYTVQSGDTDSDGVSITANALPLQMGKAITDLAGNAAALGHSAVAANAQTQIDTTAPTVSISANLLKLQAHDTATLTLRFSEDPGSSFTSADLVISGGSISALSGSGLVRTATFTPNANLQGAASVVVSGNAFVDAAGNPNADGSESDNRVDFVVDTLPPGVLSMSVFAADGISPSGWLNAGDKVRAKVVFSEAVTLGNTSSDTPSLVLQVGGQDLVAQYLSGSGTTELVFEATITQGLNDSSGVAIAFNGLALPGTNPMQDDAGNDALLGAASVAANPSFKVDTIAPTAPVLQAGSNVADGLTASEALAAGGAFSVQGESGARINLVVQQGNQSMALDGLNATGQTQAVLISEVQLAQLADGDASLVATVVDAAGNASASASSSFKLDRVAPTVSISASQASLKAGDSATITFSFSENPGNTFQWDGLSGDISVSGGTLSAITGTGLTRTALFRPLANTTATAVIRVASNQFADAAGNANSDGAEANNQLSLAVDTVIPQLTSMALSGKTGAQGNWLNAGDTVDVGVVFSKAMLVQGTPVVELMVGNTAVNAVYVSGSGQATWVFRATLSSGLSDLDGIAIVANAMKLSDGASVRDAAGNNALTQFPAVVNNPGYLVDTTAPTLTINRVTGDDVITKGDQDAGVTLSGTSDAIGRGVLITFGSQILTATVNANGQWQINLPELPADGTANLRAVVSDIAGNLTSASRSVSIDTVGPALNLDPKLTTGAGVPSNADKVLNRSEYTATKGVNGTGLLLNGTTNAEDGSTVVLQFNDKRYSASVNNGAWSITLPGSDIEPLINGSDYSITVGVRDAVGNAATPVNDTLQVRLDTSDVPTVQSLNTNSLTPTLSGLAQKITPTPGQYAALGSEDLLVVRVNNHTYTRVYIPANGGSPASVVTKEVTNNATLAEMWGDNASVTPLYQDTSAVLSYNSSTSRWSLSLPSDVLNPNGAAHVSAVFDVQVGVKAIGDVLKVDSGQNELAVRTQAFDFIVNEVSADSYLNALEHDTALVISGSANAPKAQDDTVNTAIGRSVSVRLLDPAGNTVATYTTQVNASGDWSLTVPTSVVQSLAEGLNAIEASMVSIYGTSQSQLMPLMVDTTAPELTTTELTDTALTALEASAFALDYASGDLGGLVDAADLHVVRQFSVTSAAGVVQSGLSFTDTGSQVSADLSGLADGAYQFHILSRDAAGNSTRQSVNLQIDKTAPTISLTRSDTSAISQSATDVGFVVALSEPMLGLTSDDISLTNASLVSWTPVANSGGLRYTLVVRASSGLNDSLGVAVNADAGTDAAGNANAAVSTSVAFDTQSPTLTITSDKSLVGAGQTATITFSFANDDPVGFEWLNQQGDINLANGTLSNLSGSGRTYTATFTPLANVASGAATISVDAGSYTDALGNPGAAGASPVLMVDTVAPQVLRVQRGTSVSSSGHTNLDSVDFLVNFSEAMQADSLSADSFAVQLNGSTLTSGITIGAPVWVEGNQYRVSVSGTNLTNALANANGSLSLVLATDQSMQDLALNSLVTATIASSQSYLIDNTAPAISAVERGTTVHSSGRTSLSSLDFIVSFNEAMDTDSLSASNFEVRLGGTAISSDITLGEPVALGDNRYSINVSGSAIANAEGVLSLGLASNTLPTDRAGNSLSTTLPATAATYTLDRSAPTAVLSSITDDVSPLSGTLTDGARTNDTQVELTGTNETGSTVEVYDGTTLLGTATVTGTSWTYLATLVNGSSYNFKVTETDVAGNTSAATSGFALTSDTTAPSTPTSVAEQGTSVLGDDLLNDSEADNALALRVSLPTTGSLALAGDVLMVLLNGQALSTPLTRTLDSTDLDNGYVDFSLNPSLLGSDGAKSLTARLQDGAGNLSGQSTALAFSLDTTASAAPSLVELGSSKLADSYLHALEASTPTKLRVGLPTTGALAVAGDNLRVLLGTTVLSSITLTASHITAGQVDVTIASTQWGSDGSKTLTAVLTDQAGNTSAASTSLSATLDTVAPTTTVETAVLSSDSGSSSTDWVTNTATQTISGTLSANLASGEVVQVSIDGGTTWAHASASLGSKNWSLARTLSGSNTIKVKVSDAAGNDGSITSKSYVFDTVPTRAPLLSSLGGELDDEYLNTSEADAGLELRVNLPSTGVLPVAGDRVELLLGGTSFGTAKVITLTAQDLTTGYVGFGVSQSELGSDGLKSLTAIVTDQAGNASDASEALAFTLDTSAPSNSVASIALSADSGTSGDFVTNSAAQDISGTLDANLADGETVRLSLDEGSTWQTATTTTGSKNWKLDKQNLGGGSSIWVQVIDNAGNAGPLTTQAYTLDITAPTPTLTTAILPNTSSMFARSNEVGKLYLVNTSVVVTGLSSITSATDNLWNSANVISANADTSLSLSDLVNGTYRLYASDNAGNLSLVSSNSMTIDSTAPPSITSMALSADTGALDSDFITKTAAQTITGTLSQAALAGQKVRVSVNGGSSWVDATTTVGSTQWSLADQTLSGNSSIKAKVVAVNGLESLVYSKSFSIDTTAPTTTVTDVAFDDDSGSSSTDLVTQAAAQTISGTLSTNLLTGEWVYVSLDNGSTWVAASTTVGSKAWSLADQTISGSNTLKVKVSDTAGNDGTVFSANYVLDTSGPSTTVSSVALSADTGSSSTDFITNTAAQTISGSLSGSLDSGDTVWVSVDNGSTWTAATTSVVSGVTRFSASATLVGSNSLKVKVSDAAGNDGSVSSTNYVLDTSAPTTTVTSVTLSDDTGSSSTDFITNTAAQTISGTLSTNLISGEAVYVSVDNGSNWTAATTSVGSNTWSVTSTLSGSNTIQVKVSDTAGNDASTSSTSYVLDTTVPDLPTVVLGSGVGNGATSAEATAATGVVSVSAQSGTRITVSFSRVGGGSVSKTVTGNGSTAVAVTLTSADLLTLGDGTINVSAVATDTAGNDSSVGPSSFTLDTAAPTTLSNITLTPSGGTVVANTLNSTNTAMAFAATIGAGQATGGRAEFYVNNVLIGSDNSIGDSDTTVSYTTSDGTPTTAELQQAIAAGGTVSVKLFDGAGNLRTDNATTALTRDLVSASTPSLTISSALVGVASSAEATTASGIVTVTGESAASILVTFTRSGGGTVYKTVTGNGSTAVAVVLNASDLLTLGDGSISVNAVASDAAGNPASSASTARTFTLDATAPTVTITSDKTNLMVGETATLTFTFSEDPGTSFTWNGTSGDLSVSGATVGAISGSGLTRTATLTALSGVTSASVNVTAGSYVDSAGNSGLLGNTPLIGVYTVGPPTLAANIAGNDTVSFSEVTGGTATLSGTNMTGATVTVVLTNFSTGGRITKAATVSGTSWSTASLTTAEVATLGAGSVSVSVSQTVGGVTSNPVARSITIDSSFAPPTALVINANIATDDIINGAETPTISGTATTSASVTVTLTNTSTGAVVTMTTVTADPSTGVWTTALTTTQRGVLAGDNQQLLVSVTQVTTDGRSASASRTITIDTVAPTAPGTPALVTSSDTGTVGDNITNLARPTFTGKATPGAGTVNLYQGSTLIGSGSVNAAGVWTIQASSNLASNTYSITAKQLDAAGNLSAASSALSVTVDTTVATPTLTALTANNAQPLFSGTAEAGATVEVTDTVNGTASVLGSTRANNSGAWSFQATGLISGSHSITVKQTDIAGNVSSATSAYTFTVDNTLMGLPTLTDASDSGLQGDGVTRIASPVLSGVAVTKGGTVQVYNGANLLGSTTADASTGVWSLPTSNLSAGSYSITAKDVTANKTSAAFSLTLDFSAAAPVITAPALANVNQAPTLSGTAEANATITLTANSTDRLLRQTFTTTANASGVWTIDTGSTGNGQVALAANKVWVFSATQTDVAGNTSPVSASQTVNYDTSIATPTILNLADNAVTGSELNLAGTGEASNVLGAVTVRLYDGTTLLGTTITDYMGGWMFTTPQLSSGAHTLRVEQVDAAGNLSAQLSKPITVDTTVLSAPALLGVDGMQIGTVANGVNRLTTSSAINFSAADGSAVSFWGKLDTVLSLAQQFLNSTDVGGYLIYSNPNIYFSGTYTNYRPDTNWHQYVVVQDGLGNTQLYIDGVLLTTTTGASTTFTSASLTFGGHANNRGINGSMRDIKVWDVSLTQAQVTALYQGLATGQESQIKAAYALLGDTSATVGPALTVTGNVAQHSVDAGIMGDNNINTTSPILQGQAAAGATVEVWDTLNGVTSKLTSVTANSAGVWTANLSNQAQGMHSYVAKQINVDGSVSTSTATSLTIDTTAPSQIAAATLAPDSDSGILGDRITNVNTPTLTGTANPNAWVSVYAGGVLTGKTQAGADGKWSYTTIRAWADGTTIFTVRQEDAAGNLSPVSGNATTRIDTTVSPLTFTVGTGAQPLINGSDAEAGATVEITDTVNGTATVLGTATANSNGVWSFQATSITSGTHSITVKQTDTAGNVSSISSAYTFAIATPPVAIDLNRDGQIGYSQVVMDVYGDGRLAHTAWVAQGDGLLVWDKFNDGVVHERSQYVFATTSDQTDLQGLAAQFDSNHDGVFDAADAAFADFGVWQDANQDGVTDAGEFTGLADWGISAIALNSDGLQRQPAPGVTEQGHSSARLSDGTSLLVADARFDVALLSEVALTSAVQGQVDLASDGAANVLQLSLQDVLGQGTQNLFNALNTTAISGTGLAANEAQHQLLVRGDANDFVKLDKLSTDWTATDTVVAVNGHNFCVYKANHTHAQLLIDQLMVQNPSHVL